MIRRVTATAAAMALFLACSGPRSHAFSAYRYDTVADCLEPPAAVDVIEGEDPGPCDSVRCWQAPGGEVYVTMTACHAPPGYRDGTADGEDTPCGKALAAWARDDHGLCPSK